MKEQPPNDRMDTDRGKGTYPHFIDSSIIWETGCGRVCGVLCHHRAELDSFTLIILNGIKSQE